MKHLLSWSIAVLFTTIFAVITLDFYYTIVVSILSFIGSYTFWNSWLKAIKKTAKHGNA